MTNSPLIGETKIVWFPPTTLVSISHAFMLLSSFVKLLESFRFDFGLFLTDSVGENEKLLLSKSWVEDRRNITVHQKNPEAKVWHCAVRIAFHSL